MEFAFKFPKPLRVAKVQKSNENELYDVLEEYVRKHVITPPFDEAWDYIQDLSESPENPEFSTFLRKMFGEDLQKKSRKVRANSRTQ